MQIIFGEKLGQKKWDEFVSAQALDGGLLQSFVWGELQMAQSKKIFRLAVEGNDKILAEALVVKQPLPLGFSYFYLPRGPVVKDNHAEAVDYLLAEIKKLAKSQKAIFLRFDPAYPVEQQEGLEKKYKAVGQVQPKKTLILDLKKTEEELLASMKAKTRYNIRVAQKHDLVFDEGEKYFEDFWRLMGETSDRDEFTSHSKSYYQKMLATLSKSGAGKLLVVKDGDRVAAAMLAGFFGRFAIYFHGASDYALREKMAPYLLQWQAITMAKKAGYESYDFWGVDEKKWPGVTRFKLGFFPEGKVTEYAGAFDVPYQNFWYNIYRRLKK